MIDLKRERALIDELYAGDKGLFYWNDEDTRRIANAIAAARREGAAEMRERAARAMFAPREANMNDDVVAELESWLKVCVDPGAWSTVQRARDEIVALRQAMTHDSAAIATLCNHARAKALEEAATLCLRKARDYVIPIGQDNWIRYSDGCVSCAAAIRALKDK